MMNDQEKTTFELHEVFLLGPRFHECLPYVAQRIFPSGAEGRTFPSVHGVLVAVRDAAHKFDLTRDEGQALVFHLFEAVRAAAEEIRSQIHTRENEGNSRKNTRGKPAPGAGKATH